MLDISNMVNKLVLFVLAFPTMVGAMLSVYYTIQSPQSGVNITQSSPQSGVTITQCARLALGFQFCAARTNTDVCEPLTTDWCDTMTMSPGDGYLVKETVVEKLQEPTQDAYERTLPISLKEGSELEMTYQIPPGWTNNRIALQGKPDNFPFSLGIGKTNIIYNTAVNDIWLTADRVEHGHSLFTEGEVYAVKIVCASNGFQFYVDGALQWTFPYRQQTTTAKTLNLYNYGYGQAVNLLEVVYKAA